MPPESIVPVRTSSRSYEVRIGQGTIASLGSGLAALVKSRRVFIVVDVGVDTRFVRAARISLAAAGFEHPPLLATIVSEEHKSLALLESVLGLLAAARMERDDPVIAIGGGILGDLVGFAAAMYRRGVPIVQVPTTLLAMVDASVGGKTAVNLFPRGPDGARTLKKNLAGAFHQPTLVIADMEALESLPDRQFRSGLAECIKHGLIGAMFGDADLFAWTEANAARLAAREGAALQELISRNVALKARVVEMDEFERTSAGAESRMLLNLGHTFAHALEAVPSLSPDGDGANAPLLHGEAVAMGLLAAARLGVSLGMCEAALPERLRAVLERCSLPTHVSGMPLGEQMFDLMLDDKKSIGKRLHMIVPTRMGYATIIESPNPPTPVMRALDSLRRNG